MQTNSGWAAIEGAYQTPATDPHPYRIYAYTNADTVPVGSYVGLSGSTIKTGAYIRGEAEFVTMFGTQRQAVYDPTWL